MIDGGEGAKELIGDVGEDGGAARGDFIFGEEKKEAGEEFVDGDGGAELLEVGGEDGRSFRRVLLILRELGVGGNSKRNRGYGRRGGNAYYWRSDARNERSC